MLTSTVFKLCPEVNVNLPITLGNAFYAVLLQLVSQYDPDLAVALHDHNGPKPFTTSPLQGPQTPSGRQVLVHANEPYWLRVTSIDPYLSRIMAAIETDPPPTLRLHDGQFVVTQVSSQPQDHPWAACTPYDALYTTALRRDRRSRPQVTLRFESPTAFNSQGRTQVLPLPRLVFGSLLQRWNQYAPFPLDEDLIEEFEIGIDIERHELKTVMQHFRRYQLQVGFVGECTYGVRQGVEEEIIWAMRLLARFALFSGVGTRTTMGMGQVRPDTSR